MPAANFEETLEQIVARDPRYALNAYLFVREALDFTQKMVERRSKEEARHVSGQELLAGIRKYALKQFGPMTQMVLSEWGIQACEDFGEVVFNMVENDLLAKTTNDSREDFKNGYSFFEAFRRPYLPIAKEAPNIEPDAKPTRV